MTVADRISTARLRMVFQDICELGPRWQGSAGEGKIVRFLEKTLGEDVGVPFSKEAFPYLSYEPGPALLQVLEPGSPSFACQPLAYAPSKTAQGELVFVPEELLSSTDFSGKIVLTDAMRSYLAYPVVSKGDALGLILGNHLSGNLLRAGVTSYEGVLGDIPAVSVGAEDTRTLREWADRGGSVRLSVSADAGEAQGFNLVVHLGRYAGQAPILICSHYDSMWLGPHACDNATGTAAVLELIRSFKEPPCPLVFLLCGAEELGFWGSRAFAREHSGACRQLSAVLCTDALSSTLGAVEIGVTDDLAPIIRAMSREHAMSVDKWSIPPRPGSDHASFARFGMGTVWLTTNSPYYHTAADGPEYVDADNLAKHTAFVREIIVRLAKVR